MFQRIALGAVAVVAAMALSSSAVHAQDIDELDEGVALETPFELGIEAGVWELGLQIGYIDFSAKLMEAKNVVVDVRDPQDAIFADMELVGDSSFQPLIRVNRNFGTHLEFVNSIGFAIGDYTQKITSPQEKWISATSTNTLTALEIEQGSYFMWRHEHGFTYYPRGKGAFQPFLTAGIGTNHFSVDSAYISGSAGGLAFSYGGGIRVVADDLFSLTLEVRNYQTKAQYDVAQNYEVLPNLAADAEVSFPVSSLANVENLTDQQIEDIVDRLDLREKFQFSPTDTGADMRARFLDPNSDLPRRLPQNVKSFDEQSYSSLWISLGFTASF
jgi:opacity protein-like surface antigen